MKITDMSYGIFTPSNDRKRFFILNVELPANLLYRNFLFLERRSRVIQNREAIV
jgi:hypothetical protein